MKRQYSQYAQKEIAIPSNPQLGMQSIYFDPNDGGNPKRINSTGTIVPVGGLRVVDNGGQVGWTLAINRTAMANIGIKAIELVEPLNKLGIGANGDYSIAIGVDSHTTADNSVSIGRSIEPIDGVALGKYNIGTSTNIFELGDGIDGTPSNVMQIDDNSVLSLPNTNVLNIVNPKDVVTVEKLEAHTSLALDYDEHTYAIKGTLIDDIYPGFQPYIPASRTKKVIGIRWYLKVGSCSISITERDNTTSYPIISTTAINSGTMGQFIWSDPNDYYDLTDGRRIELGITNVNLAEDLSVTVILLND